MSYLLHLGIYLEIYILIALSLNLVAGYCGLLTLAHAGYVALGAYTYAILTVAFDWIAAPALILAGLVGAVCSALLFIPSWRLRGDFFLLSTLAVQVFIFSILNNWADFAEPLGTWRNLTNGPLGIAGIPRPSFFGLSISSSLSFFIMTSLVVGASALLMKALTSSPWGRALTAMRDDELAAQSVGKNTRRLKMEAIVLSSALAAAAGGLYASYVRYIDPTSASLHESILLLAMVLVGGAGNFRGPIVGALLLVLLPEMLRFLALPDQAAASIRLLLYGATLTVLMHIRPQGLAGNYKVE